MPLRLQLPAIGVAQEFITFKNVTMEGERFICVRETGATNQVSRVACFAAQNSPSCLYWPV